MEKIVVNGGKKLSGTVNISGAKNAVVAIIPAVILCDGVCRIENVPDIEDVHMVIAIMQYMGASVRVIHKSCLEIDPRNIKIPYAPYSLVSKLRGSAYFMGALLGKFSHAEVGLPGGCNFGVRPIDQHLKAFSILGAKNTILKDTIKLEAEKLKGKRINLDVVSVGATINAILASVKADGKTIIENAAKEPHIVDVANFLNTMGAEIRGAGTDTIKIEGVKHLNGVTYSIIPDQIEAGTYMAAVAATGGDLLIKNVIPKHLDSISAKLREMGVTIQEFDDSIRIIQEGQLKSCNVKTSPHPGFPTDMQPQIAVLLAIANGTSMVTEAVWDKRFDYVPELQRMGANITVDGKNAIIKGVGSLTGALVKAVDLRAGAAMIIAALAANGTTQIEDIEHIERGYEDIIDKFSAIGADINHINTDDDPVTCTA